MTTADLEKKLLLGVYSVLLYLIICISLHGVRNISFLILQKAPATNEPPVTVNINAVTPQMILNIWQFEPVDQNKSTNSKRKISGVIESIFSN